MLARLLILCASAAIASAASIVDAPTSADRFRLACSGTLAPSADRPVASPIMADGIVDLVKGNVYGFGLGGQPIRSVTLRQIAFGDGAGLTATGRIEGSIDRQTLETRIVVHARGMDEDPLIAMRLACHIAGPSA
jgi:hypothetical protein